MSIDPFRNFTPGCPSHKSILWRRSIVRHLENLQRKGGFKGFNKHAVSLIIAETDPRKQAAALPALKLRTRRCVSLQVGMTDCAEQLD
jgi:hypothetical protein